MDLSAGSTDFDLIARAQRREHDAWEMLVDLYGPWIYNWTRRLGLSAEDGADATQETLLAVHRSIGQFQLSETSATFRGWLWTVLRNKVLDQQRRRVAEQRAVGGSALQLQLAQLPDHLPDESSDVTARDERQALLARGLAQVQQEFEPRTWESFWKVVVENRSPAEVAMELGTTAMAVRQAKSRVLRRLRDQLHEAGPGAGTN